MNNSVNHFQWECMFIYVTVYVRIFCVNQHILHIFDHFWHCVSILLAWLVARLSAPIARYQEQEVEASKPDSSVTFTSQSLTRLFAYILLISWPQPLLHVRTWTNLVFIDGLWSACMLWMCICMHAWICDAMCEKERETVSMFMFHCACDCMASRLKPYTAWLTAEAGSQGNMVNLI